MYSVCSVGISLVWAAQPLFPSAVSEKGRSLSLSLLFCSVQIPNPSCHGPNPSTQRTPRSSRRTRRISSDSLLNSASVTSGSDSVRSVTKIEDTGSVAAAPRWVHPCLKNLPSLGLARVTGFLLCPGLTPVNFRGLNRWRYNVTFAVSTWIDRPRIVVPWSLGLWSFALWSPISRQLPVHA